MSTLGDLTPYDLGRRVEINSARASVQGALTNFSIDVDWILEVGIGQDPSNAVPIPGRRTMTLVVGEWATDKLPLNTTVEFL